MSTFTPSWRPLVVAMHLSVVCSFTFAGLLARWLSECSEKELELASFKKNPIR